MTPDAAQALLWLDALPHMIVQTLPVFAVWLVGLGAMLLIGQRMGDRVLELAETTPTERGGRPGPSERRLRARYGRIITAAAWWYWLFLPWLLCLSMALLLLAMHLIIQRDWLPPMAYSIALMAMSTVAWAALQALWVWRNSPDPGEALDPEAHPRLFALLREVAQAMDTRPVDTVFLMRGTEMGVFERAGDGPERERCLLLGLAFLDGLHIDAFKGVLAHEYGHFINADTAAGPFVLRTRMSLAVLTGVLRAEGVASWLHPTWALVRSFELVFLRISQGASRLQEVLADRWATWAYGPQAIEHGLTHAHRRGLRFAASTQILVQAHIHQDLPLLNLYQQGQEVELDEDVLAEKLEEVLDKTTPYDSHPPPRQRIEWVYRLPSPGTVSVEDTQAHAWDLFEDPVGMQERMTRQIREDLGTS